MEPVVHSIYEPVTGTWQYIVACPETKNAIIIDPVLDLDLNGHKLTTSSADQILEVVAHHGYTVVRLLETHAHADHLTAAVYIQQRLQQSQGSKAPISTGHRIKQVQKTFATRYMVPQLDLDGAFDHLLQDAEVFPVGNLSAKTLHLPGYTPDDSGYQIGNCVFTGDSIFNPDVGTARCDFPNGDANALFKSIQQLLAMPRDTRLYTGHDYPPDDKSRNPLPYVTVAEQLEKNKHVKSGTQEQEFVNWRRERDQQLKEPRLLHEALQVNIRGGHLPRMDDGSGRVLLMVPMHISF